MAWKSENSQTKDWLGTSSRVGTTAFVLLAPNNATAENVCGNVSLLLSQVEAGTADKPETPTAGFFKTPAEACLQSLSETGARSHHCRWPFEYRDVQANNSFKVILSAFQNCYAGDNAPTKDQDVNHPDYYDLRSFQTANGTLFLSLKDKGALQKTYLFIRFDEKSD